MNVNYRLALEAGIVGVILAAVLAAAAWVAPVTLSGPAWSAATGMVVGAAFHLAFEAAGLNRAYCAKGHACQK